MGKKTSFEAEVERLMKESGKIYCPECSTSKFKIYHEPGKHIKELAVAKQQ